MVDSIPETGLAPNENKPKEPNIKQVLAGHVVEAIGPYRGALRIDTESGREDLAESSKRRLSEHLRELSNLEKSLKALQEGKLVGVVRANKSLRTSKRVKRDF